MFNPKTNCSVHQESYLETVCLTCRKLICYNCREEEHASHDLRPIYEFRLSLIKEHNKNIADLEFLANPEILNDLDKMKIDIQKNASQIIEKARITEIITNRTIKQKAAEKEKIRVEAKEMLDLYKSDLVKNIGEIKEELKMLEPLKKLINEESLDYDLIMEHFARTKEGPSIGSKYKAKYEELKRKIKDSDFNPMQLINEAIQALGGDKKTTKKGKLKELLNNLPLGLIEIEKAESNILPTLFGLMGISGEILENVSKIADLFNSKGWLFLEAADINDEKLSMICEGIKTSSKLEGIWLDNNFITDNGLSSISNVLDFPETRLLILSLNNNNLGPEALRIISQGIKTNSYAKGIMLSHNKIGDTGLKYFKNIVQSGITCLFLADNQFTAAGAPYIKEALSVGSALHVLWLEDNNLGDIGCELIGEALKIGATELECLSLSNNNITAKGIKALGAGMKKPSRFRCLIMNKNPLGLEGAKTFAEAAKATQQEIEEENDFKLEALGISDCGLGDDGFKVICDLIKERPIKALWANGNNITATGAKAFADFMSCNNEMKLVSLRRNKLGNAGAIELAKGFNGDHNSLDALTIANNEIGPEGISEIVNSFKEKSGFTGIDISYNPISDKGAKSVSELLKSSSCSLKILLMENCGIGNIGCEAISAALKENSNLTQLFMDQNPFTDDGLKFMSKSLEKNDILQIGSFKNIPNVNNDAQLFIFMSNMNLTYTRVDDVAFFIVLHEVLEDKIPQNIGAIGSAPINTEIPYVKRKNGEAIFKPAMRPNLRLFW